MKKVFTILFFLCQFLVIAQTPKLVMDFNPGSADAVPSWGTNFLQVEDKIFIVVLTASNQTYLYVIKNDTVSFLETICTDCNPPASGLLRFNNKVIFATRDNGKHALWISDGTSIHTSLLTELADAPDYMLLGNNNMAYIAAGGNLYVNDGTGSGTRILNSSFLDFASHKDNDDDKIFVSYKNGIAFLTNKFGLATLNYADDAISTLATFDVGSSFTDLYGLCEVADGLVFGVENDGLYHYHESTGVKKTTLSEPLRVMDFNGMAVHYHYGKGLTLLHDFPLKSTPLINKYGPVIQSDNINRAIVGDKMIIHIDDYNSFDNLVIAIDKSTKSAQVLGEVEAYPSNFVSYNENIFFFDGTSNGFRPSLYHLKDSFSDLGGQKTQLNFSSTNGPSAIPVGMNNNNLYFFSNLDASKGRELYKIAVDINTSVDEVAGKAEFDFTVVNDNIIITGKEEYKAFEVIIMDTAGKVLDNKWVNAGETTPLPQYHQTVIIMVLENESKKALAKKIFMN